MAVSRLCSNYCDDTRPEDYDACLGRQKVLPSLFPSICIRRRLCGSHQPVV